MAEPLIGITSPLEVGRQGPWEQRYAMLPETYLLGVQEAGGVPVLLPPQPVSAPRIARVLDALDGLVLPGGADVDPGLYGAGRGPHTQPPRHDRDAWERALVLGAIDRDLPVLAICRGVQLMNAALGGTLVQHLPDVIGSDAHDPVAAGYGDMDVVVTDGTLVARVLGAVGTRLTVHCHHHQALDRLAEPLEVVARSADGVIEAVEAPGSGFVLGVQWHPEQDVADRRLFAALVDAAVRRAADAPFLAPLPG